MDLDAILERSRNPGQFVERQAFTLSRSKALSKMRDFTLRSIHQFGLELVQAGVFAGANWVFVDADRHQATVGWIGGRSLKRSELEQLMDYLFVAEGASEDRHLRQLAVAVNALVRQKPLLLRVESGGPDGSVRLDLDGEGEGTLGIPEESIMGTYLHVRFSDPWFWETNSRSFAAEMVETECIYSPVPVFVNGNGPYGWDRRLPLQNPMTREEVSFRNGERDGWLGYPIEIPGMKSRPRIQMVVGGVIVSRRKIPELGEEIEGVIRDDNLAKTADMSDVVADHRFARMLHHLVPVVRPMHVRRLGAWEAPELPPLDEPTEAGEEVVEVRPLEEGLTVLGLNTLLSPARLVEMPGEPLFWVDPEHVGQLEAVLAPERFPGRVVVVDPPQRNAFAAMVRALPDQEANQITPDAAAFVADQLRKGVERVEVRVPIDIGLLGLCLHADGRMPGWRVRTGGVPLLILHPRHGRRVRTLVLDLPGVSATLELDGDVDPDEHLHEVAHRVETEIWQLAAHARDPGLVRALLAQAVWLQPRAGGVDIQLPSSWPAAAAELLDLPLVPDGPTARELLGTLGSDGVVEVSGEAQPLLDFVRPFGPGHVHRRDQPVRGLIVLQWDGRTWEQRTHLEREHARAMLVLPDRFGGSPPPGWERHPVVHPLVLACRKPGESVDWEEGLRLFGQATDHLIWEAEPDDRALVGLVRMALGRTLYLTSGRGGRVDVAAVRAGEVTVGLVGGPGGSDPSRVAVTLDQARVLGEGVRWALDDAPSVWSPEPLEADWLVTEDLVGDGLVGWIGLRLPYDPTAGVLLQRGLVTEVVEGLPLGSRVHGWLRRTGGDDHVDLLEAALARVLDRLRSPFEDPSHEEAARSYRADFAVLLARHPEWGFPADLPDQLAAGVPVGEGSLLTWLRTPPSHQGPLPFEVRGMDGRPLDPTAHLSFDEAASTVVLDALRSVLARVVPGTACSVHLNPDSAYTRVWVKDSVTVAVGGLSNMVQKAENGDRRALGMALLDAVRALVVHERRAGVGELDLLALHRAVLDVVR